MGEGTSKTKRNAKQFRTPVAGSQMGISAKHRTGVPLPMAKPYGVTDIWQGNCLPELSPKATKLITGKMDSKS